MVLPPRYGLSLCSGGGGLDMGLELAEPGFAASCYVEWDAYPRDSLIAGQRAGYIAPAPIWDNVKTFDARPWRGIDTVLAGYPCFVAGTIICTKRGHIPIEEVAVGDLVLTHTGKWRPVTATMSKRCAPVRRIKAQGVPGVVCTDEHPFYLEDGEWRSAENIQRGDRIGQVLPDVDDDTRSPEFWWVIGRYLADGWRQWSPSQRDRQRGRVSICCARHEAYELERRIRAAGFSAYRSEERTTTRFAITKHDLYEFCAQFGTGASGKHLPGWVLGLDETRARALCEGYFSGDGYRYDQPKGGTGWRVTTVSKALALSFGALAQRAYGVVASVRRQEVGGTTEIEGRTVRQRTQYILIVPDRNRSGRIDGRYGWKRVRENDPCGTADVFNIAVDGDESYVADGAIVHNCQPFSHAGQRKGEDDPRHLWPDILRILGELGDELEWCFFENVAGHLSLGFETVHCDLRGLGFSVAAGIFSAQEVGAPHERQRLFIVAHRQSNHRRREQPESHAWRWRPGFAGEHTELADPHGGHSGAERQQCSGQHRLHEKGGGAGATDVDDTGHERWREIHAIRNDSDRSDARWAQSDCRARKSGAHMGNTQSDGRNERRAEHVILGGRDATSSTGGELADAGQSGSQGREQCGSHPQCAWEGSHEPASELCRPFLHPPGPSDFEQWAEIISHSPQYAPASALDQIIGHARGLCGDPARSCDPSAEPDLRRMAHGLAARSRALRLLGNGVHPLAAAYAWRTLSASFGLGSVDLGASAGTASADGAFLMETQDD